MAKLTPLPFKGLNNRYKWRSPCQTWVDIMPEGFTAPDWLQRSPITVRINKATWRHYQLITDGKMTQAVIFQLTATETVKPVSIRCDMKLLFDVYYTVNRKKHTKIFFVISSMKPDRFW